MHIFGFSESKHMMGSLAKTLHCRTCCGNNIACIFDRRWKEEKNTQFLASCSESLRYGSAGCEGGGSLHYQWVSSARLPDANLTKELERGHALGHPQVVVYSLGPHFFAQYPDHTHRNYDHEMELPQVWQDEWDRQVELLMAHLAQLRRTACVVWKTNNLGYRHPQYYTAQPHPSIEGGTNDVLSRRAAAAARKHGLAVSDVSVVTVPQSRAAHNFSSANVDFYHSYNNKPIADALLRTVAEHCPRATTGNTSRAQRLGYMQSTTDFLG